jgi:hypothetical protein
VFQKLTPSFIKSLFIHRCITGTIPSFDAAWRYEEIAEEADFFGMDELRELALQQASVIKQALTEKENREKSQQHQFNISKHFAQLPPPTFTGSDVSNRMDDAQSSQAVGMTPARPLQISSDRPMLSPTLNFTTDEEF